MNTYKRIGSRTSSSLCRTFSKLSICLLSSVDLFTDTVNIRVNHHIPSIYTLPFGDSINVPKFLPNLTALSIKLACVLIQIIWKLGRHDCTMHWPASVHCSYSLWNEMLAPFAESAQLELQASDCWQLVQWHWTELGFVVQAHREQLEY